MRLARQDQDSKEKYLFELQFNGCRVRPCDGICDVITDFKCLIFRFASQVDKNRIGVAINHFRTPLFC
jgi:hypothetical protein